MTEKFEKTKHLPVTPLGPKPGDFPIGSPESRAAARSLLDRGVGQEIPVRIIYHRAAERPIAQTKLDGKTYELCEGDLAGAQLYPKTGNHVLPTVTVPPAEITIRVRRVGEEDQ